MMIKRVSFLCSLILSIFMGLKVEAKERRSAIYTQYASEVTSTFLKEVYKEYGYECGASGGQMPFDIEEISVNLVAYHSATVEEARDLIVKLTERFAIIINNHEKIRPFLREFPFPASRVDVAISFSPHRKKKYTPTDNDVAFVFQARNKIFYQAEDPDRPYVEINIQVEPFEEALKIVKSNASKPSSEKPKKAKKFL